MTTKHKSLADALRHRVGWSRTAKGNLKRHFREMIVIVFSQDDSFGRCVLHENEDTTIWDDRWDTEDEAIEAANEWIDEYDEW